MLRAPRPAPPELPIVANVDGEFYPTATAVEQMLDMLGRQVASPVQFVKGLRTLYDEGARSSSRSARSRRCRASPTDVLGDDDVLSLSTNHPKQGDVATFNKALCGLWAAGPRRRPRAGTRAPSRAAAAARARRAQPRLAAACASAVPGGVRRARPPERPAPPPSLRGRARGGPTPAEPSRSSSPAPRSGCPGAERLFDDANIARILDGEQFIDVIPGRLRREMLDKHITRLVKGEDGGADVRDDRRLEAT